MRHISRFLFDTVDTEFGKIGLTADETGITNVYLPGEAPKADPLRENDAASRQIAELLREAARQISEYLNGARREFDLPVSPAGTAFMRLVWDELRRIPYGETATYAQIAARVGRSGAYRAVGLACNRNPIPIMIPCHRVIGSSGKLTGYRGGLTMKERLLVMEAEHNA